MLDLYGPDRGWADQAPCSSADPDAWFPSVGESGDMAKRVCGRCPVRSDCLEYALDHDEGFGIWGGLSEHERRKLRRRDT